MSGDNMEARLSEFMDRGNNGLAWRAPMDGLKLALSFARQEVAAEKSAHEATRRERERAFSELREIARSCHTLSPQEFVNHCMNGLGEPMCAYGGEVMAHRSLYEWEHVYFAAEKALREAAERSLASMREARDDFSDRHLQLAIKVADAVMSSTPPDHPFDSHQGVDILRQARDAALLDAARLRDTGHWLLAQERNEADSAHDPLRSVFPATAVRELEHALSASDSAAWLKARDAEIREQCIAVLVRDLDSCGDCEGPDSEQTLCGRCQHAVEVRADIRAPASGEGRRAAERRRKE